MNRIKTSLRSIWAILKDWRYLKVALLGAAALGYLNYWLFYKVGTISGFFQHAYQGEYGPGPFSLIFAYSSVALTALTVIVFGISSALLYWLYRHSRLKSKGFWLPGGGVISSAFGAACPVCGAFLLQLLGVTAGVSAFPLKGLEFKLLSLGLLGAATMVSAGKIMPEGDHCEDCVPTGVDQKQTAAPRAPAYLQNIVTSILIVVLALNHILIGQAATALGVIKPANGVFASIFGIKPAAARTIIATKLNPDGRTTTLAEWPTISEIPANPNTGDAIADAKAVVIPAGTPFYAPEGISFDDPLAALNAWGKYESQIQLSADLENRYQKMINTMMTCDYCCGGPTNVTLIGRCGCAHAQAWRSIAKYLLQNYGDKYSDDEIVGELKLWRGVWYPKGAVEDYLLATGKGDLIGHETHGGAGADGRHGY